MSELNHPAPQEDEISLKEMILSVQGYLQEFLRNWKLIGLVVVLCISVMVIRALMTPVLYPAEITFMVNEDEGGNSSAVGAILGQFGLGGSKGDYNLDKIVELSKSMRIVRKALFEKAKIKGREDYFINHIILLEDFHEKWKKDTTGLKDFLFTRGPENGFTRTEKKALKKVYVKVRGNPENDNPGMVTTSYSEVTAILTMKAKTQTPGLSIAFLKEVYDQVSDFYIRETTEKPQTTYNLLKAKRDSLFDELSRTEIQLARTIDSNIGLVSKAAQLKIDRLRREVQFLTVAYSKALENTEIAEFSLQNATPFFQIIDEPITPLKTEEESWVLTILLGGIIGGILGLLIVILRKIYREAMA